MKVGEILRITIKVTKKPEDHDIRISRQREYQRQQTILDWSNTNNGIGGSVM